MENVPAHLRLALEKVVSEDMITYLVVWGGGYEAPSYVAFNKKEQAMTWTKMRVTFLKSTTIPLVCL